MAISGIKLFFINSQVSQQYGCYMSLLFVAVDDCISVARITHIKLRVVARQQADARQL